MPVYSEIMNDNEIKELVRDRYKNILIVGCGACMNESLAYKHDTPLFVIGDNGNPISYSVLEELRRLTNTISGWGYNVQFELLPEGSNSRCMLNYAQEMYQLTLNPKPDVILTLSCPSGAFGIKAVVGNIPVIKITRQLGFLAYGYIDESDGTRVIIKEKSGIIP